MWAGTGISSGCRARRPGSASWPASEPASDRTVGRPHGINEPPSGRCPREPHLPRWQPSSVRPGMGFGEGNEGITVLGPHGEVIRPRNPRTASSHTALPVPEWGSALPGPLWRISGHSLECHAMRPPRPGRGERRPCVHWHIYDTLPRNRFLPFVRRARRGRRVWPTGRHPRHGALVQALRCLTIRTPPPRGHGWRGNAVGPLQEYRRRITINPLSTNDRLGPGHGGSPLHPPTAGCARWAATTPRQRPAQEQQLRRCIGHIRRT